MSTDHEHATSGDKKHTAYVIPHTHWDREWYHSYRVFQARLADVIEEVLRLLDDPAYRRFTLDGQAATLDDYLELHPEREDELRRRVREGRLRIGPWYVLADEFLVSPEALVRNLQLGRRVCERFGAPLPVCYTPDSFGHISQLPLIAAGFGLDAIVFQRGLGDEGEELGTEFYWVAADGETAVFTVHLLGTYSGAAALGHVDWELTDPYSPELAAAHVRAALYGTDGREVAALPGWFRASLERVTGGLLAHSNGNALVLLNGSDHLFPQPNMVEILADLRAAIPEVEFVQGDVEEFVDAARASVGELGSYQGEMRGSRYQHILAGVLSARLYLKRENEAAQTLLERYAEPLSTMAFAAKGRYPSALLRQAWKLLLQNHPHDSICGCSIDPVHRAMLARYKESREIGEDLLRRAIVELSDHRPGNIQEVGGAGVPEGVTVYNPLAVRRSAVVSYEFDAPVGTADRLRVLGSDGEPVPLQLSAATKLAAGASEEEVEELHVEVLADLAALGMTNLRFDVSGQRASSSTALVAREEGGLVRVENEHVALSIDGSANLLFDRKDGRGACEVALSFEDVADAGDEYDFSPLPGDEPLLFAVPLGAPELVAHGPVRATARLAYSLELPLGLAPDRRCRAGVTTATAVVDVSLAAGAHHAELTVRFDNLASDHRLRLIVGTNVAADVVHADGHYDVLERPVEGRPHPDWFQAPPPTSSQRRFVAVSSPTAGLALLNKGLPEYEARHQNGTVELAVTLVRSVGWLSRTDMISRPQGAGPLLPTPEAQCLGSHTCELALYPFSGAWWESDLLREAQAFTAPPRAFAGAAAAGGASLFSVTGPVDVTAVKRAEDRDSVILRLSNPTPAPVVATVELGLPTTEIYRTRLDETRLERLPADGELHVPVGAKSVTTLEFVLGGGDA